LADFFVQIDPAKGPFHNLTLSKQVHNFDSSYFKLLTQISQKMTTTDFTTTILVDQTPTEAFNAINNPRGWWSEEIEGGTDKLNDVFNYHFEDIHRAQIKLIEVVQDQKVVWHVLENYFKFTEDTTEWTDTKMSFEITKKGDKTQIRFTHIGLVPEYECFEICTDSWTQYIRGSLFGLITQGKGEPNAKGKPTTDNEKRLSAK
jgi:hypothetical protein